MREIYISLTAAAVCNRMLENNSSNNFAIAVGVLTGVVMSLAIGVLFASMHGEDNKNDGNNMQTKKDRRNWRSERSVNK